MNEIILKTALGFIGRDASPADEAPDELGCAETVSDILFDSGCKIPILVSTYELNHWLKVSPEWKSVILPGQGDVVISPTGEGGENGITHGHTGIVLDNASIGSNNSATGTFERNYTIASWQKRYGDLGGYPVYYYRYINGLEQAVERATNIEVAEKAIEVSKEALQYPTLLEPVLKLLTNIINFLKLK